MQEESDYIIENQALELSATSPDRIFLFGKWVFKLKQRPEGEITCFKAL